MIKFAEVMDIIEHIYQKNRRVFLFQSGENKSQSYIDFVCKCVSNIKQKFNDVTIILCLGNLSYNQYRQLRVPAVVNRMSSISGFRQMGG